MKNIIILALLFSVSAFAQENPFQDFQPGILADPNDLFSSGTKVTTEEVDTVVTWFACDGDFCLQVPDESVARALAAMAAATHEDQTGFHYLKVETTMFSVGLED